MNRRQLIAGVFSAALLRVAVDLGVKIAPLRPKGPREYKGFYHVIDQHTPRYASPWLAISEKIPRVPGLEDTSK